MVGSRKGASYVGEAHKGALQGQLVVITSLGTRPAALGKNPESIG